ncbi:hypothetical protein U1Q18_051763 [Sarracenia purpurea var. burkii]
MRHQTVFGNQASQSPGDRWPEMGTQHQPGGFEGGHEMGWEAIGGLVARRKLGGRRKMEFYQLYRLNVLFIDFLLDGTQIDGRRTKKDMEVFLGEFFRQL